MKTITTHTNGDFQLTKQERHEIYKQMVEHDFYLCIKARDILTEKYMYIDDMFHKTDIDSYGLVKKYLPELYMFVENTCGDALEVLCPGFGSFEVGKIRKIIVDFCVEMTKPEKNKR